MKTKIAILAAGSPHFGDTPSLNNHVGGLSILDWQLNSLKLLDASINIVVGFRAMEVQLKLNPSITIIENTHWQSTSSSGSLLLIDLDECDELWVSYGDVLYHQHTINKMSEVDSDIVVAYDSEWQTRYLGRDVSDISDAEKVVLANDRVSRIGEGISSDLATGEFIGVVRITGFALNELKNLKKQNKAELEKLPLVDLLELLRIKGMLLKGVNVKGQWAELNEPRDLAHFVMGTKAETLSRLYGMVKNSVIQKQVSFTVADWENTPSLLLEQIHNELDFKTLVVRSSALSEDAFTHSNAGAYTSVLNVKNDAKELASSISSVIKSYHNVQNEDQVLVQPMLTDVVMSGVAFTRTLEHGAPYYVINYEESGSTEGITSGQATQNSVFYFYKKASSNDIACPKLRRLITALQEIESLLNYDALDIEFAVDFAGDIHIFQVRPISLHQTIPDQFDEVIAMSIEQSIELYEQQDKINAPIVGEKIIFGNMPDWNPAEIIGTSPSELAYSLYKYLILDEVWAQQRAEFGYRDVRPNGLLKRFAGKPYIDVRASFNSFVPQDLPIDLTEKLVDFYSKWLIKHPHLHDKIEFDVVPTCLSINFKRWEHRLINEGGFNKADIFLLKKGLTEITNNAVLRIEADLSKVEKLDALLKHLDHKSIEVNLNNIKSILDDCKRLGTLPFAHLARAGFIAVTFLKEAVDVGLISKQAYEGFLESIQTVSHSLTEDALSVKKGSLAWDVFVRRYGHLRPGTYDINSLAYHEDSEHFLRPLIDCAQEPRPNSVNIEAWKVEKARFFVGLRDAGISFSDEQLESFLRLAIEGREKAKFIFSRSLSIALDMLKIWGENNRLERVDIAELSIMQILEYIDHPMLNKVQVSHLKTVSELNKESRKANLACALPPLIVCKQDFMSFTLNENHPNYIGSSTITARLVDFSVENQNQSVVGKIVMIPQADPGFDWLFGQGIAGLITMYGGANSHMAIRSAEFGLPAAIGIGESFYKKLSQANKLELDPANSIIRVVH